MSLDSFNSPTTVKPNPVNNSLNNASKPEKPPLQTSLPGSKSDSSTLVKSATPQLQLRNTSSKTTDVPSLSATASVTKTASGGDQPPPFAPDLKPIPPSTDTPPADAMVKMLQSLSSALKDLKEELAKLTAGMTSDPAQSPGGNSGAKRTNQSGGKKSGKCPGKGGSSNGTRRANSSGRKCSGGSCSGSGGSCPGCSAGGAGGRLNVKPSNNPAQQASLQQTLDRIAQDPEGAKLLEEAKRRGVKIQVGDTGKQNVLGLFDPNTNTVTVSDPENIKTIVHELVHATTPEDGNSKEEEATANIIGDRVQARLNGRTPRNPSDISRETKPLYGNLKENNPIRDSLFKLGLTA
jgi:hypothetical protein